MIAQPATRRVVRAAGASLLALAAVLPARAENLTFITDFGFNGRHAYYYVAIRPGWLRR
jgi:NitT/TauT family transport system substrate-binding protein